MEAIIIHKRSFTDAFRQAEIETSHAVHDAIKKSWEPKYSGEAIILEEIKKVLVKLKERLIES